MQDALLSDNSLAMLAGNAVKKKNIKVVGREVLKVEVGEEDAKSVEIAETPVGTVHAWSVQRGIMVEPISTVTVDGKVVSFGSAVDTEEVMVFYEYIATSEDASQVTFSANAFPETYRVVGDTVVREQGGVDRKMQFQIPQAKLQSSFSLTMDVENVSVFDFNLDVMTEAGEEAKLYDIIRL